MKHSTKRTVPRKSRFWRTKDRGSKNLNQTQPNARQPESATVITGNGEMVLMSTRLPGIGLEPRTFDSVEHLSTVTTFIGGICWLRNRHDPSCTNRDCGHTKIKALILSMINGRVGPTGRGALITETIFDCAELILPPEQIDTHRIKTTPDDTEVPDLGQMILSILSATITLMNN